MDLTNRTPLFCLPLNAVTPEGQRECIVIVKLTLDLVPAGAMLQAQGFTHWLKLSQEQVPIALQDSYHGEFLNSSMRWESDTAAVKPKCDVVVLGEAHAPGGKPHRSFQVRLRLGTIQSEPLLDKRLRVTGARWLQRRSRLGRVLGWVAGVATLGLWRRCPWSLTRPQTVTVLPLRYEFSFGGHIRAQASDGWSRRVPGRRCLPGVDPASLRRAWAESRTDGLLAEAMWEENFVGCGYAPRWYLKAAGIRRLPAPQIEDPGHPFTAKAAWRAMAGKGHGRFGPALRAQGMGVTTRNAMPRVQWAGTWDQDWAASGTCYPPDYSVAFNNYAHPDLQCRHLEGDEVVELTNLCSMATAGACDREGNQVLRFQLPGLFPFLLVVHASGHWNQVAAVLDTVILAPGEGKVTLLQRARFGEDPEPTLLELRMAMAGEPREVPFLDEDPADEAQEARHDR
jgi:hypothetical protein